MSDAKPYTVDELAYWESMSEALPVNHRAKLRATVEALERVTKERDEALASLVAQRGHIEMMSTERREFMQRAEKAEKDRDDARAEVERLRNGPCCPTCSIEEHHPESRLNRARAYIAKLESEPSPRSVAERQREACAKRLDGPDAVSAAEVRATPLVTDGGGE